MNTREQLERLQQLTIEALIKELESGDTTNINVANTLLTANKVVSKPEEGDSAHSKVKKIIKREVKKWSTVMTKKKHY